MVLLGAALLLVIIRGQCVGERKCPSSICCCAMVVLAVLVLLLPCTFYRNRQEVLDSRARAAVTREDIAGVFVSLIFGDHLE